MTVDELLDINPNIAHVAKFMKEHPEIPVRFWDDGTVDITIPVKTSLHKFIVAFKCPSCDRGTDGPALPTHDDIRGSFRECHDCGLRFFIHNTVKFGGTT